jgi:hypothetical protein
MSDESPLAIVAEIGAIFDQLRIPYVVGGSIASSFHGIPRATQDADIVAAIDDKNISDFIALLGDAYYADAGMIREAVSRRASFNIVHQATMFKVDVFVMRGDSYSRDEVKRGIVVAVETGHGVRDIRFATAEDTVLQKLVWFKLGGEISERQWNDVLGVLRVQPELDEAYLDTWADLFDVMPLLSRARRER